MNNKNKILYPIQGDAYSETFVKSESDKLIARGYTTDFLNINSLSISPLRLIYGIISYPLAFLFCLFTVLKSADDHTRLLSNFDCLIRTFSNITQLRQRLMNVVEVRCHFIAKRAMFALIIHRLFHTPYSLVAHAADIFRWDGSIKSKIKFAKRVDCISNYNKGYIDAKTHFKFAKKLTVIRNSFYLNSLPYQLPEQEKTSEKGNKKTFKLLYIGRMVKKKNLITLLNLLEQVSANGLLIELVMIGEGGNDEANVLAHIKSLNHLKVTCLGYCNNTQITQELKKASFTVLLSSHANKELPDQDGIPTIFLESLALGIPVITTEVSGIPELVIDMFNGIILKNMTADELTGKLDKFEQDNTKISEQFERWYKTCSGSDLYPTVK